jgi:hypothetical protein
MPFTKEENILQYCKMVSKSFDLKIRTFEQFDGSIWRQYETPDYRILLTGVGRRLFATRRMHRLLGPYIADYLRDNKDPDSHRPFLSEGGNAKVFSLTEDFVVKESLPRSESSLFASMDRTDRLKDSVEKHCPRWIDIPDHYGAMISRSNIHKQFMLVQKIDHGVTVGDVINYQEGEINRSTGGALAYDSLEKFGEITPQLKAEVFDRFDRMKIILADAVREEGLDVERFLPDINTNPYNVVLEKLDTPEAGSFVKYWVIFSK